MAGREGEEVGAMTLRFGSVCSGIEAASTAWEPLGWSPQFYSEIDPFPCHVLHHHWSSGRPQWMPDPDQDGLSAKDRKARLAAIKSVQRLPERANGVPNFGDMTQYEEWPDAAIDVLVGGTPCQSYSVAGLRKGLDDPRGDLMLTYAAIARRYRPRWVVWENVFGVLSSEGGRDFASLLGLLSGRRIEVPSGGWRSSGIVEGYERAYGLAWRVLDTQYVRVDGAPRALPQRRRRVFVVGRAGGDWRRAAAVLLERASLSGNPAPRREAGKGTPGTIGGGPDGGRITWTVSAKWAKGSGGPAGDEAYNLVGMRHGSEAAPALTSNPYGDHESREGLLVAHSLRAEGFDASEDGTGRGTPLVPVSIAIRGRDEGGAIEMGDDVAHALRASQGGGDKPHVLAPIAFMTRGSNLDVGEVAGTIGSNADRASGSAPMIAFDARQSDVLVYGDIAGPMDTGIPGPTIAFDTTQITSKSNYSKPKAGDPYHPLAAGAHPPAVAFTVSENSHGFAWEGDVSATLQARQQSATSNTVDGVVQEWAVRRLTPTECARLQGFADDHCRIPWRGKPADQCPDGPQYKAFGNSMSTNVMRWIGERIAFVDQIKEAAE